MTTNRSCCLPQRCLGRCHVTGQHTITHVSTSHGPLSLLTWRMVEIPALFSNLGLYQRPFVVTPSSIGCTGRVWKHARPPPSGIAGRHPDRTNALKYNRALDWNAAKHHREPPTVQPGQHSHGSSGHQPTSDPTGLYRPIGYTQIRPDGDPTPAVRRTDGIRR